MLPLIRRLFGLSKSEPVSAPVKRSTSLRLDHSCARTAVEHQRPGRAAPLQAPRPKR